MSSDLHSARWRWRIHSADFKVLCGAAASVLWCPIDRLPALTTFSEPYTLASACIKQPGLRSKVAWQAAGQQFRSVWEQRLIQHVADNICKV